MEISLKTLVETGAHFGHQSRRWNPKMEEYIYGQKDGVHIFDLTKTKLLLNEALNELTKAQKEGKTILLLGTKKQAKAKLKEIAEETGTFYITERWLGGLFTNFRQIKRSVDKLADMKKKMAANEYSHYTKKERLLLDREIQRLERFFGGIAEMKQTPDLLFVIDTKREAGAVREANAVKVKTIGVVDTNCDPTDVTYPIPMNDDASKAVSYLLDLVKDAILEGKKIDKNKEVKEKSDKSEKKEIKTKKISGKPKKNNTKSKTKND